ncbi:hypothetical protein PO508_01715 [Enterobacter hormaechei]|uniref:hypothetical protein n=1 Tax=Enterobacter hormaechei TaxID=158836 RepID=UPI000799A3C8|nr:hypothetical protein [Enterobacter hormaechei]CZW32335.1 Uncharacterised protein [Enterobacter hormaechei]
MKQKFIEWFTKNNNGCSPAMEDDRSFVYEMTQHMFEAYQAGVAEGEARCAALAAELNVVEAIHNDAVFITDEHYEQCPPEVQKMIRSLAVLQIPAYQAFLAEVRAHDLNAFIQHHSAELDAHIKNGGEQFDEKSVRIRDIIVSARLFREQIRKEAAQ